MRVEVVLSKRGLTLLPHRPRVTQALHPLQVSPLSVAPVAHIPHHLGLLIYSFDLDLWLVEPAWKVERDSGNK